MNYFTKSRIYIFLIILLALLNVSLMLFFWKGPPSKSGRRGPGWSHAKLESFVTRKLEFSTEQTKEYGRLRRMHFQELNPEVREMRRLKRELFGLVGEKNNFIEKQRILEQISKTQLAIDSLTFNHFENLRDICDEGQKLKFDEVIKEVVHRLDRPGRPPHGGRRGR